MGKVGRKEAVIDRGRKFQFFFSRSNYSEISQTMVQIEANLKISKPRPSGDWPQIIVENATIEFLYLHKIVVGCEFPQSLVEQDHLLLVEHAGSAAVELLCHFIDLLQLLSERMGFGSEEVLGRSDGGAAAHGVERWRRQA